eukprot:SAG22_NODE_345_length_11911_cov_15.741217_4_plen_309_part_00
MQSQPGHPGLQGANQIVQLNVGGTRFTTTLATLRSQPGSTLSELFATDTPQLQLDAAGCYFIDRDGSHFRYILNFLRDGTLPATGASSPTLRKEMKMEAAYYNITQLLSWAQAADEVDPAVTPAHHVLDAYTQVVKTMLGKVYGRSFDELIAEAIQHLTAVAEQGTPVGRVALYGRVDGARDFLIPAAPLGSAVAAAAAAAAGGLSAGKEPAAGLQAMPAAPRQLRPEEIGAPGLEAAAETFVGCLEEMGFPCSASNDGKILVDIQVSRKALPLPCVSTAFQSKTVPFSTFGRPRGRHRRPGWRRTRR